MKKRRIHILPIRALTEETFPKDRSSFAAILCTETENACLSLCLPDRLLRVPFTDTEDKNAAGSFSASDAVAVREFLGTMPGGVSDLFLLCDAGESRSTAMAAALLLSSGQSDMPVWDNPHYHPNALVFMRLCRAFGIRCTRIGVARRKRRNTRAFGKALGRGTAHVRFEIL